MKNELELFKRSENAFPVDFGTCLKPKLRLLVKALQEESSNRIELHSESCQTI